MSVDPAVKPKRLKKGKSQLPLHLRVRTLIDPDTGAQIMAFTAAFKADRLMCKERGYRNGDLLRADVSRPRNPKFNNLVHGLGTLVKKNCEAFDNCADAHAVIKRLQRESGTCCEEQGVDVPGLGQLVLKVAQSIAFDAMPDEEFHLFWHGICRHLVAKYWPTIEVDAIEAMIGLMPEREA